MTILLTLTLLYAMALAPSEPLLEPDPETRAIWEAAHDACDAYDAMDDSYEGWMKYDSACERVSRLVLRRSYRQGGE